MILAAKIKQPEAQSLIAYLKESDLFDPRFKSRSEKGFLYFAVLKQFTLMHVTFEMVSQDFFPAASRRITLRDALSEKLSQEELSLLKTAFDQVGGIAILEIDEALRAQELLIAQTLLSLNATIKTVLRKDGKHQGVYRSQPMKFLAGVDTREALLIENGVRMKVDVEKVYFSSRLANERVRIGKQVKNKEAVLVLFSGAAPQPLVIEKIANPSSIVGIEINPHGHEYGLRNLVLNKSKKITLHCGDVHEEVPKLGKLFDRVVMNLPKTAYEFLDDALSVLKPGGVLHYYDFLHEDEFDLAKKRVSEACAKIGRSVVFNGIFTVGSQGIKTYRICVDCVVS